MLANIILHDKKASTAERVAWAETLNLPTRDAARAMKCMAWTAMHAAELKAAAGVSLKGRKATGGPVYSCSLSWEKGAAPSDGHMRETGLASLGVLGLSGHEAVLIRHTDTEHDHLHIVVNLVHPETGRRAKLSKDRLKLSEWAERYEREHGQIVCPKRVQNNERRRHGEFVKHRAKEAAQAIGFEAECDRHKAKLREIKRQQQEIVAPRQQGHETAAIAISADADNDNEERDNTCEQTPEEDSRTRTPGGGGRSRRRGGRASLFRSPLRKRRERRFTSYRGKRRYRADPDRVTPGRGMRFRGGGKKKPVKGASTGRMWTANARELIQAQGTTRYPATAPSGAIGQRRSLTPVPYF